MAEWINVFVGVLNAALTALIAYAVSRAGRRVARLEQDRAIKDAWVQVDQAALANEVDLKLLDGLLHPDDPEAGIEARRKRWLAYMILNPVDAAWSAAQAGHMPDGTLDSSEATMRALVRDDAVYELIRTFVYNRPFRDRCAELRAQWLAQQDAARPPSTAAAAT